MNRLFCSSMLVCLCTAPAVRGDESDDAKKMQGRWKPVTAELAGKPYPTQLVQSITLVVADGKYTVTVGQQKDEGTVKLDPTQKPAAMDLRGTRGPNQGKTILAIYELTDNTLRICYDLSGKSRPAEFNSKPETRLFLVEYKRVDSRP